MSSRAAVGSVAGSWDGNGYRQIRIDGRKYRSHRLAWLHVHGSFPEFKIDHDDGDRGNNRLKNLRAATHSENGQNRRGPNANGTSGVRGVSWDKRRQMWHAHMKLDRELIHIGHFSTLEAAKSARIQAASQSMPFTNEGKI